MGTMILRSHTCLQGGLCHGALPLNTPLEPGRNPTSNPSTGRRRKRGPAGVQSKIRDRDRGDQSLMARVSARNLVMGQVKILKRGEKLLQTRKDCISDNEDLDLALGSTDRLGPDPETVQKQIRVLEFTVADGIYAGSNFFASPPPSSVPVPGFLGKKNGSATTNLRRLLRLDSV